MLRFAQHDSLLPACVTHLGYTTLEVGGVRHVKSAQSAAA